MKNTISTAKLSGMIYELSIAIDSGSYAQITMEDVKREAEAGRLFTWLEQTLTDADFSLWDADERNTYQLAITDLLSLGAGYIKKKFGVYRLGLPVLISLTQQLIANALPSPSPRYTLSS